MYTKSNEIVHFIYYVWTQIYTKNIKRIVLQHPWYMHQCAVAQRDSNSKWKFQDT